MLLKYQERAPAFVPLAKKGACSFLAPQKTGARSRERRSLERAPNALIFVRHITRFRDFLVMQCASDKWFSVFVVQNFPPSQRNQNITGL